MDGGGSTNREGDKTREGGGLELDGGELTNREGEKTRAGSKVGRRGVCNQGRRKNEGGGKATLCRLRNVGGHPDKPRFLAVFF